MKDRNDYARCFNERSVRLHRCRLCPSYSLLVLQWEHLPRVTFGVCAPCAAKRWQLELATGEKAGLN